MSPEHCPAEKWRTRCRCDVCPAAYVTAEECHGSRLLSPWLQARRISNQCGPVFTHRLAPSGTGWTWIACKADVSLQRLSSWRPWERTVCHSVGSSVQPSYRRTVLHISAGQGSVNRHSLGQTSVICLQYIWHGNVVTHLRCGRTYNDHCFINLMLNLTVKEFGKSADISWSYGQDYSGTLFDSRCS